MKDFSLEIQMQDQGYECKMRIIQSIFLKSYYMIKSNREINMYVHLCAKTRIWPVFKIYGLSKQAKKANYVTWTRWESVYSSIQNGYFLNYKFVVFFAFVKHQIYLDLILCPLPKKLYAVCLA